MSDFPQILIWLSSNVFVILSAVASITVACVLWSRAQRAAVLLFTASMLQLLLMIAGWFFRDFLQGVLDSGGDMTHVLVWSGLVTGLLHAMVYGLLIWAAAMDRGKRIESLPVVVQG